MEDYGVQSFVLVSNVLPIVDDEPNIDLWRSKWTCEMEADFIELLKPMRHVWDRKNRFYPKKSYKVQTFYKIIEEMKKKWPGKQPLLTYGGVLKKYQNLKAYYRKESKKHKLFMSENGLDNIPPKWEHFERLSFLDSNIEDAEEKCNSDPDEFSTENIIITPDISLSNPNVSSDDSFLENPSSTSLNDKIKKEPIFEDPDEEQWTTRSSTPEPSTSHRELATPKKKRKMLDERGKAVKKTTSHPNEAEKELTTDDHFTNYVNATLKSFKNIKHKELCKAAISSILTEYLFKEE